MTPTKFHPLAFTLLLLTLSACTPPASESPSYAPEASATSRSTLDSLSALTPQEQARLDTMELRLQRAEARESIRTLFAAYGRHLDQRDFVSFSTLFSEKAVLVGGNGTATGPEAIARLMEDAILPNASGANLHVYSNEVITIAPDARTASATSRGAFIVQDDSGAPSALIYATYNDQFIREGGHWKFHRREIRGDIPGDANEARFTLRRM